MNKVAFPNTFKLISTPVDSYTVFYENFTNSGLIFGKLCPKCDECFKINTTIKDEIQNAKLAYLFTLVNPIGEALILML